MDPSAIRDLILNLKLQLLALPNLARWGLITFAGIIVAREIATAAWNARQRRRALPAEPDTPHAEPPMPGSESPHALPAPNLLDVGFAPAPEAVSIRRSSTPVPERPGDRPL